MTCETIKRMVDIHEAKNADYGNSFELAADLLGRPVVEGARLAARGGTIGSGKCYKGHGCSGNEND